MSLSTSEQLYTKWNDTVYAEKGLDLPILCSNDKCCHIWVTDQKPIASLASTYNFNSQVAVQCPKCKTAKRFYLAIARDAKRSGICISRLNIPEGWLHL